jgi:hypothetical protein
MVQAAEETSSAALLFAQLYFLGLVDALFEEVFAVRSELEQRICRGLLL